MFLVALVPALSSTTTAGAAAPGPHVFSTVPAAGAQASVEATKAGILNTRGIAYHIVVEDPDGVSSLSTARSLKVVTPNLGTMTVSTTFAYVAGSGETKAVITAVQRHASLTDGTYSPTLVVRDKTNSATNYTWSFAGGYAKPHVNSHTPERDSIAASPVAAVVANVSGGQSALSAATMSVDGAVVGATLTTFSNTVNTLSWTPPAPLDPGEHVAQITATNAAGLSNTYFWSFYVSDQHPGFNVVVPANGSLVMPDDDGMMDIGALCQDLDGIEPASITLTVHTPLGGQVPVVPSTSVRVANKRQNVDVTARFQPPPQAGTFLIAASATDLLGNVAGRIWTFSLPINPPAIDQTVPDGTSASKRTRVQARIRGVGSDLDLSTIILSVDGVALTHSTEATAGGVVAYADVDFEDNTHHAAQVVVSNVLAQASSYSWEFDVAAAPTASDHKPLPDSVYNYEDVPISVRFTEPDDGVDAGSIVMYFDGEPLASEEVSTSISAGGTVLGVSAVVKNVGGSGVTAHTVAVVAGDARGCVTTETWTFSVIPQTGLIDMEIDSNGPCQSSGCHSMTQTDTVTWNKVHWVVGEASGWGIPSARFPHRYNCSICHYASQDPVTNVWSPDPMYIAGLRPCYMCHPSPGDPSGAIGLHGGNGTPYDFVFRDHNDSEKYRFTTPDPGRDCLYCHQGLKTTQRIDNFVNNVAVQAHDAVDDHRVKGDDPWCTLCHSAVLTREHAYDRDGPDGPLAPLDCDSCHESTDTRVLDAIRSFPALRYRFWGEDTAIFNTQPVPEPTTGAAPYSIETTGYYEVVGRRITGARIRLVCSTYGRLTVEGYADGAWNSIYTKEIGGTTDDYPGTKLAPKPFPNYPQAIEEFSCEPVDRVRITYEPITPGWHYVAANVDSWVFEGALPHENEQSCDYCHDAKPAMHGYDAADHQPEASASACFDSSCHANADLLTMHTEPAAAFDKPCQLCHTTSFPFDSAECGPCHTDKVNEVGEVIAHGEADPVVHTASATAVETLTGAWAAPGDSGVYNPPYEYEAACTTCHDVVVTVEHAKASASSATRGCGACHPSPRSTLTPWAKSCTQAGCHTLGTASEQHASAEEAHVPNDGIEGAAGCSATWGSGADVTYPCHYMDLVQEHNRVISGGGTIPWDVVSVSCVECHSTAAYAAMGGEWDGWCEACHPMSHGVSGSARANEVYGKHTNMLDGAEQPYEDASGSHVGTNAIEAHGPVPLQTTASKSGCSTIHCHNKGYLAPGFVPFSGTATVQCTECHGANVLLTPPAVVDYGLYSWFCTGDYYANPPAKYGTATMSRSLGVLPVGSHLQFATRFMMSSAYDYWAPYVSTNGTNWTQLMPWHETSGNLVPYDSGYADWTGDTGGNWIATDWNLSAWANGTNTVYVRFNFTNYMDAGGGLYIDNITAGLPDTAAVFSDDAETDTSALWTRQSPWIRKAN